MRFEVIGIGPGPKNVLLTVNGKKIVTSYRIYKEKYKTMADGDFSTVQGEVQQFKDQPVVREREVNGATVRDFTIKSYATQNLIGVTLFPEWDHVDIERGTVVSASGPMRVSEKNGITYRNLTARSLATVDPHVPNREDREPETVNKRSRRKVEPSF